jgi:hypothetical protein
MKRRSLNKQQREGDVKKFRSKARNAGRGAAMAGPNGEPRGKDRPRNAGSRARQDRLTAHQDPRQEPGSRKGGSARGKGYGRHEAFTIGRDKSAGRSRAGGGRKGDGFDASGRPRYADLAGKEPEPGDDTRGARRPEEHGGTPYMNRGAGNRSNRGDTHGGKKSYHPASKVQPAV